MENKEIYERIADTYLGKANQKKSGNGKNKKKKWIIIATVINAIILVTVFFFVRAALLHYKEGHGKEASAAIYILSERYPIKLPYDLLSVYSGIKDFSFSLPVINAEKYKRLVLRVRGDKKTSFTSLLKIVLGNQRGEKDSYYLKGIHDRWEVFSIPLKEFKKISDWSNIKELSFMFEEWNVSSKTGIMYIDNISFSE